MKRSPLVARSQGRAVVALIAAFLMIVTQAAALVGAQDASPIASPIAESQVLATYTLPEISISTYQNEQLPSYAIEDDRGFVFGGVGSDLWHQPGDPENEFWVVTDRGPAGQVEVNGENRRTFPVPELTPHIFHLRAEGDALDVIQAIPIVDQSGAPVTGISPREGVDEVLYDATGETPIGFNPSGIDPEGLVRTSDGTFWLVDEYLPSLVHVDADGAVIERYLPEGVTLDGADYPVADVLPALYSERRENRGFEGLAISGDESTLYLALQSPLYNPDSEAGQASRNTRILAFDIAAETPVAEYAYTFDPIGEFDPESEDQDEMKISGLLWLDEEALLVLERTDLVAKLYRADIGSATNLLGTEWDDAATLPTLEQTEDLEAAGVTPMAKSLVIDLDTIPSMPNKIEGIALLGEDTIAVINDDDFNIDGFDLETDTVDVETPTQLMVIAAPGL